MKNSLFRVAFSAFLLACWAAGTSAQEARLGVEQGAGAAHEAKGTLKREAGRAIGNPRLASEGEDERAAGRVRRKLNEKV